MSAPVRHYLSRSGVVALATLAVLALAFQFLPGLSLGAAFAGWAPMALIGVVGGGWAVSRHGRPGHGFPLAVLTCILLRLSIGLGGAGLAALADAAVPYLAGSLLTFATMQAFEMLWFLRHSRLAQAEGLQG